MLYPQERRGRKGKEILKFDSSVTIVSELPRLLTGAHEEVNFSTVDIILDTFYANINSVSIYHHMYLKVSGNVGFSLFA